jgi:hypothetical protein
MAGRLVGDARNWLNHTSLRRAGFTVVLLGAGGNGHRPEREAERPAANGDLVLTNR